MRMAALAHFRQLCCLGGGAHAVMPSLLSALHDLIPSRTNAFFWTGPDGRVKGFLPEYVIPDVAATLVDNFDELVNRALATDFATTMLKGRLVGNLLPLFRENFYRSDVYDSVCRPYDLHHALGGVVPAAPDGRGIGALVLGRSHCQPPFTAVERETLASLFPYLIHAFQRRGGALRESADDDFVDSVDSGMFILDGRGRTVYASAKARQFLYLATCFAFDDEGMRVATAQRGERLMMSVYNRLTCLAREKNAAVPVVQHENPLGRFVFRGYWLEPLAASAGALIGVVVQQQEPVALVMMRKMQAAGLSEKQKETCLLLQRNLSFAAIAIRLRISHATAKDYADRTYRKLGVHTREEMLQRLCQSGAAAREGCC